jgi:nicotinic acid phosphoribosyltransferase
MNSVADPATPPRGSLALLTDLYQLTMACGYWKSGTASTLQVNRNSRRY